MLHIIGNYNIIRSKTFKICEVTPKEEFIAPENLLNNTGKVNCYIKIHIILQKFRKTQFKNQDIWEK